MTGAHSGSISRRLLYGLTTVVVLSSALTVALIAGIARRQEERTIRKEIVEFTRNLARIVEPPLWDTNLDRAQRLAEASASDRRVVRITIRESVSGAARAVVRSATRDTVSERQPVLHEGMPVGEVIVSFDRGIYWAQIVRAVQIAVGVTLIALVASLVGVRLLLRKLLDEPLAELSTLVGNYAAGNYGHAERPIGFGELRTFSAVLGAMGDKIVGQLRELGESNTRLASEILVRQEAEAALRLQGAALEAAANAIVITDRDGVIEWTNTAFSTSTGFSRQSAIGSSPGALLKSGKQDAAFYESLWATILSGKVWQGEIINRREDGSLYSEEMTITPLKDERGEITHFIAVKQDISQRKVLEEEFRQAQKMQSVGRLAGGVAHDFNNMLSVILGHADLAMRRLDPAQPLAAHLSEIREAAERSAGLTRQLLAFARKQAIAPRVLDLNAAVANALKMLQRLIGEDIELCWRPAAELWPIRMDQSQLDQVLANLCVNARDAIAGVGTLTITTDNQVIDAAFCASHADAAPGEYVRLRVTDDGCGMSAEVQSQIFEPFFTTKEVGEGTGLGLATVYGAVRQNGGLILVTSEVGKGTTFEIFLPRHVAEHEDPQTLGKPEPAARGRETILLVEDEPMLLRLVARTLVTQGYSVLKASGPNEAIRLAQDYAGEVHLILTDVVMPGMNGIDLVKTLRSRYPRLICLFMSGYTANITAGQGMLDDPRQFIAKPFTTAELGSKVREVLDRSSGAPQAS